jgi:hypothetical protein
MHTTKIKMKDGSEYEGILWNFRPWLGWIEFAGCQRKGSGPDEWIDPDTVRLLIEDMESAITANERVSKNKVGVDCDEIQRAKDYMRDARQHRWNPSEMPEEKFPWEEA